MNASIKHGALWASVVAIFGIVAGGCLTRPAATSEPQVSTNFTSSVRNQVIDKIDLLFDIDNSASMGDKQTYLAQAIPDLISRLLTPNCVDAATGTISSGPSMLTNGVASCAAYPNTQPEFPAVHNLHLGIVTSSLGQRLSEQSKDASGTIICNATANPVAPLNTISSHNDDQGHLIARSLTYNGATATEGTVGDALVAAYNGPAPGGGFLDWFPMSAANAGINNPLPGNMAVTVQTNLVNDFTQMVGGAGIYGCGIESQLESWYRFLVQPDPYASLTVSATTQQASWSGVDTTLLQERADFLRPDSLVAVIVLTDENDSEVDVRSLGGAGYLFMGAGFQPPMGTGICATNPADPTCTTQAQAGVMNFPRYMALNDWGFDPNLRHVHMREKYGIDPQYPWQRYVLGLTSPMVPDRMGEYPPNANNYIGNNDCTNPLFAASLPSGQALMGTVASSTLCKLPPGTRTKDLIFYAIIGGVPHQLLHFDPNDAQKSQLSQADWVRILGTGPASVAIDTSPQDPANFNYNGIDPHMYESDKDRTTITGVTFDTTGTNALSAANSANGSDATNGREWTTDQPYNAMTGSYAPHVLPVDREYACIFPLAAARDCTMAQNNYQCDCPPTATGITADQTPPLCDPKNPTSQLAAKAYPTIRELQVARLMGNNGIVSSLCPIDVNDNATKDDPNYGYRPAVATIINRLKNALTNQCLPQKLAVGTGSDDQVPCLILVQMPVNNGGSCLVPKCNSAQGLTAPASDVLTKFCASAEATFNANDGTKGGLVDPATQSVCVLKQLTPNANPNDFVNGSCESATADPGWCYVTNAKGCAQAIIFPAGSPPPGATANLQCIEESISTTGTH